MRKLASACLAYCAAVFAAAYVLPVRLLPWAALICLALTPLSLLLQGKERKRAVIILLSATVGLAWRWGYGELFVYPEDELSGQTVCLNMRAVDYPKCYDEYDCVYVRIDTEGYRSVKAVLYSTEAELSELEPGDVIRAEVRLTSALRSGGEESDAYTSRGIFMRGYINGEPVKIGEKLRWLYFPQRLSKAIRDSVDVCMPGDVSHFMKALLTGDKDDLKADEQLYDAMGTAGLLHIVSVSGMHVAFLVSFISNLTGKHRRRTAAIGIPIILVFIPMAGGSASVIRASFMQIAILIAPLFKRESDSATLLSLILAILLAANPFAAESVSLQLSFAAMAGILLITPPVYDRISVKKKSDGRFVRKLRRFISSSLSSTLGAIAFTTPLIAIYFGYVSLISPLTNLLTLWVMSFTFSFGYVAAITGLAMPAIGRAVGWVLAWPLRYTAIVVRALSKLPFAAIYTEYGMFKWWVIFLYAVLAASLLLRGKRGFRPAVPICACVTGLCICFLSARLSVNARSESFGNTAGTIEVLSVGQGQCIAVLTADTTVIIDCGSSGDSSAASSAALSYLKSVGRNTVDMLVLTHFHADHANGAVKLMRSAEVRSVAAPDINDDPDDDSIYNKVTAAAEENGSAMEFITEDVIIDFGGLELYLYAPMGNEGMNEQSLFIVADFGDFEMLVTGDSPTGVERTFLEKGNVPDIELLIAGHHGSKYSTCRELLRELDPEMVVISVDSNTYGHPAGETLERIRASGAEVHRTDLEGNITVKVG